MQDNCLFWLASLPEYERSTVADTSMDMLSGKMPWTAAKGLYDAGIMYRTSSSDFICPVSAWASAAYITITSVSRYICGAAKPLSSLTDGRARGPELEKQMLACLAHATHGLAQSYWTVRKASSLTARSVRPRIVALVFEGSLEKKELSSVEALALSRGEHPTAAAASTPPCTTSATVSIAQPPATVLDVEPRSVRPKATEVRMLDRSSLVMLRGMVL